MNLSGKTQSSKKNRCMHRFHPCTGSCTRRVQTSHWASWYLILLVNTPPPPQPSQHSTTLEEGEISGPRSKSFKTVTWAPGDSVKVEAEEGEPTQEDQDRTREDRDRTREDRDVSREVSEQKRLQRLQKAGIKVLPAAVRYSRSGTPRRAKDVEFGFEFVCSLTTACLNSLPWEVLTAPIVAHGGCFSC